MARTRLSIYALQRGALAELESELRTLLSDDDREGVGKLLGLGEALAARVASRPAVEWFLRDDDDAEASPLYASLRRVAKKRTLEKVWTSEHPSLEGRLRAYDTIRDDRALAAAVDRALDHARVPFFLMRKGATMGLVTEKDRAAIADAIGPGGSLRDDDLPPELAAFGDALAEQDGDLLIHDGLD